MMGKKQYRIHHVLVPIDDFDDISSVENRILKSISLFSNPIVEITNYAIEKGIDIATAYRIKNRKSKSFVEKNKPKPYETILDSGLSESNQETTQEANIEDVFVHHFKNVSERLDHI